MTRIYVCILNNLGLISGGDRHALEVFKRFDQSKARVTWVGTELFKSRFASELPKSYQFITLRGRLFGGTFGSVVYSIISVPYSLVLLVKQRFQKGLIYSASDSANDVLVGFISKVCFATRWAVIAHMSSISRGASLSSRLSRLNRILQFWSYRLVQRAEHVLVVDDTTRRDLIRCGVPSTKIVLTRNGITSITGAPAQEKTYEVVFVVSRWNYQKGVDDIEPLWTKLIQDMPHPPSLIIIGRVPREVIHRVANSRLGEHVSFSGFVCEETKLDLISKSRVLILPSRYESFSIVTLEALACAVPVVRYDITLPLDSGGVLVAKSFDLNEFSRLVERLLSDKTFYQSVVDQIHIPQGYLWDSIASDIEELLVGKAC